VQNKIFVRVLRSILGIEKIKDTPAQSFVYNTLSTMKFLSTVLPVLVATALPTAAQVVNYQPVELVSSGGMLEVTLDVGLLESLNGTRLAPAYNGETVGPTLRLKPGDSFKVILKNSFG
jgi:FtsP/CotA-like multicopper oxidase with cupredoxin domain